MEKLNTISVIASIITVINFALSIAFSFEGLSFDILPNIAGSFESKPLFFRIILFMILEVLISLIFVKIYLYLNNSGDPKNPIILVAKGTLLMCSAWTSLFNIKTLILNYISSAGAWVVFLILCGLAANSIWTYWYQYETRGQARGNDAIFWIFVAHALFLGVVFTVLIADKSF